MDTIGLAIARSIVEMHGGTVEAVSGGPGKGSEFALRLLAPVRTGANVTVRWESVSGVTYFLERSTNLGVFPPFRPLATNLPGQSSTTSFTDTNAATSSLYYRVGTGN